METGSGLGIDASQVTSLLTEVGTLVGTVGLAAIAVFVGIRAFRYIKSIM